MTKEQTITAVEQLLKKGEFTGKYNGLDNHKKPKRAYLEKVVNMTDEELLKECVSKIWLSAFANNNPKSDYHWHCDCCYDECQRRNREDIYKKAYDEASSD